jgi:hypothetical protein
MAALLGDFAIARGRSPEEAAELRICAVATITIRRRVISAQGAIERAETPEKGAARHIAAGLRLPLRAMQPAADAMAEALPAPPWSRPQFALCQRRRTGGSPIDPTCYRAGDRHGAGAKRRQHGSGRRHPFRRVRRQVLGPMVKRSPPTRR